MEIDSDISGVSDVAVLLGVIHQFSSFTEIVKYKSEAAHARLTRSLLPDRPKELGKY